MRRLRKMKINKELKDLVDAKKGDLLLWVYCYHNSDIYHIGITEVIVNNKDVVRVKFIYLTRNKKISEKIGYLYKARDYNHLYWKCFKISEKDVEEAKKLIDYDTMFRYEEIE